MNIAEDLDLQEKFHCSTMQREYLQIIEDWLTFEEISENGDARFFKRFLLP